jgi:hypothetical protein
LQDMASKDPILAANLSGPEHAFPDKTTESGIGDL